ncbi:hypothetical protein EPN42_12540 [bacterium]|nr:MAG: hypothetical protein EPN42_12540 [bacterium]
MINLHKWSLAALAGTLALSMALPALAASPKDRFSSDAAYAGAPDLALTLSMVVAGGGPSAYKTTTLVGVLAGDKAGAEVAKLQKQFGSANVAQFLKTYDFVVGDTLKIVTEKKIALPKTPEPAPTDGKALAAALYKSGVNAGGSYNVEYMLDHLVSHPIHVRVMDDIDAKYGTKVDAEYHIILLQVMKDLKAVYAL